MKEHSKTLSLFLGLPLLIGTIIYYDHINIVYSAIIFISAIFACYFAVHCVSILYVYVFCKLNALNWIADEINASSILFWFTEFDNPSGNHWKKIKASKEKRKM